MLHLLLGLILVTTAAQAAELENPSFEATEPVAGWTLRARLEKETGRKPVLAADEQEIKAGMRSLAVTVQDAGEVSIRRRIYLPVGSLWRAKAWVKTQDLKGDADPGGQLAVRTPSGFVGMSAGRIPDSTLARGNGDVPCALARRGGYHAARDAQSHRQGLV